MSTRAPLGDEGAGQNVIATAGFAYGTIGADIHLLGDGTPLYLLQNYLSPASADPDWLREAPSRMLNARYAVVGFTGRESEVRDLRTWCDAGPRLAARWLHAPGGQGKTRLAGQIAEELINAGWKAVTASHGPGTALLQPGSQDLSLGNASGLLLIVDYADRWPLTHLAWLLSNALLHQPNVRTRVLLLARTAYAWSALRAKLGNYQAGVSQQFLSPLPDESGERERTFIAARDSFAARYGLDDPGIIHPPARFKEPGWGLTLTVHMAALVAIDAHVGGRMSPEDQVGLTSYLLDRERDHWSYLWEARALPDQATGLDFQASPGVMSRAVFTAALTGPVDAAVGKAVLDRLNLELPSDRVLTDHAACYPPADPRVATVLEPLYPDRLAEDFLGVTIPGHASDQPAHAWAPLIATTLLGRGIDHNPPEFVPRAITFLAAAAERWPHLGDSFLYPMLRRDPQLAMDAGGPALTAIAGLPGIPLDVLEDIEPLLPDSRHTDLDPGMAVLTRRLTEHRLTVTDEPDGRALLYLWLAKRLSSAGDEREAIQATEEAVALYRRLASSEPLDFELQLARSLTDLGALRLTVELEGALAATEEAVMHLQLLQGRNPGTVDTELGYALNNLGLIHTLFGRPEEALRVMGEAVEIRRRLPAANPASGLDLARSLANLGRCMSELGQWGQALTVTEEAVGLFRSMAASERAAWEPDLAQSLGSLGNRLRQLGRWEEAFRATEEAVQIFRRLAAANPAAFEADLAMSLVNLGNDMSHLGRREAALAATGEGVDLYRRLAADDPAAAEPHLAMALDNLGLDLSRAGRPEEALAATEEAVEIRRRLVAANRGGFEAKLALSMDHLGSHLYALGRRDAALAASIEAVEIYRRLAAVNPATFELTLAASLDNLGSDMAQSGRREEALSLTQESVDILRRIAQVNPDVIEPELTAALSNLGGHKAMLGRPEEALAAITESVGLSRRLAARQPAQFGPYLAQGLGNLSNAMSELGRRAEALQAAQEAVELSRKLATDSPQAFEPLLATQLDNLARCMSGLGRGDEARRAATEALAIHRRLADEHPAAFEPKPGGFA